MIKDMGMARLMDVAVLKIVIDMEIYFLRLSLSLIKRKTSICQLKKERIYKNLRKKPIWYPFALVDSFCFDCTRVKLAALPDVSCHN